MNALALFFVAFASAGLQTQGPSTPSPTAGGPAAQPPATAPDAKSPGANPSAVSTPTGAETKGALENAPQGPSPAGGRSQAGQGAPAIVLAPTSTVADVVVRAPLDEAPPSRGLDFKAGPLTSTQNPDLQIVPDIAVTSIPADAKGIVSLDLTVSGLIAFGELTVPLLYRGRQIETLRFHKPGLIVRPSAGGRTVAQQKDQNMVLVLENPSVHHYKGIRARVRFQGIDECTFTTDQAEGSATPPRQTWRHWVTSGFRREPEPGGCNSDRLWSTFEVRPSSQVSLTIPLHDAWFEDLESGLARSATRQGMLTLRYQRDGSSAEKASTSMPDIIEQNVPLDVRFDATTGRLFLSIFWVFVLLLCGALFFLLLRVSIPNYRRKKLLKDGLNEARAATSRISDAVNSQLRVLLRVERLALDQRRREGWVLLPGFDELAARIEAGLSTLNRKIVLVERLDAAATRRENLLCCPVAPTRLDIIDRNLDAACETLKSDQLGDADWLLIQQHLEAADKALNEPSPEEKQAFEARLSQRWQAVRDHFTLAAGSNELVIPPELDGMRECFPKGSLLPAASDTDGTKWIAAVGVVRADLQLTALEMVVETHFLGPALSDKKWSAAMIDLAGWLATPAIANLATARQQLLQLAEGVSEDDIVGALKRGETHFDMDPQVVSPNQTVRLTMRFRDPKLNVATARGSVQCEWRFQEPTLDPLAEKSRSTLIKEWLWKWLVRFWKRMPGEAKTEGENAGRPAEPPPQVQVEQGWRVHRYFEPDITRQPIDVAFFFRGAPIPVDREHYSKVVVPRVLSHNRKDSREKWLRFGFQALQMLAVLLVPLIALAMSTASEPASGQWWDLVGIGFGSEAIRNILTGEQAPSTK